MVGRFGPKTNQNPVTTNTPANLTRRRLEKEHAKISRKKLGFDPDMDLDVPSPLFDADNLGVDREDGLVVTFSNADEEIPKRSLRKISTSNETMECPNCRQKMGSHDGKSPSDPQLNASHEYDEVSGKETPEIFRPYQELREVLLKRENRVLSFGLDLEYVKQELYIVKVEMNSPASNAGLKVGDEILYINGETVQQKNQSDINQLVHLETLSMKILLRPRTVIVRTLDVIVHKTDWLGFKLQRRSEGLFINTVLPYSPANGANLTVGDEVVKINGISVEDWTLKRALDLLKSYPDDSDVRLLIRQVFPIRHPGLDEIPNIRRVHQSSSSDDYFIGRVSFSSESGASTLDVRPTLV